MLKSLSIEKFRGIKQLSIDTMTPVTVVSGMNNVGKSSLLEAVFLLNDHDAPEVFSMLSGFRGGAYEIGSHIWEPLFYLNRSEDKIIIKTSSLDYKEQELVISADIDYAPVVSNGLKQEIGGQLLAVVKGAYALGFEYTHLNYNEKGLFYYNEMGLKANIETSLPNNARERARWTLLVNSMVSRFQNDLSEWIGKLQIEEKKDELLDALRMMSDDIQDFFVATQQGITQLYIKNRNGVIPLKYAGDGVVRFLYLVAAILANKGSLFLIDEIENGFHYSLYRNVWKVLARIAADNRSQIIATSHSYENIAAAVKGIKDAGLEDSFSLHRLEQSDGEVSDHYYDYEMAAAAVKNDMEVR